MQKFSLARLVRGRAADAASEAPPEEDLRGRVNAEFFRMLVQAPYQRIDADNEGHITLTEFAAYFSCVATEAELRLAYDFLRKDSEQITYGTLQSFQQQYDAELVNNNPRSGKVGCPDYLEYCTLLVGIRASCDRRAFLALEGVSIPPRPAWLLQRLEEEWTRLPKLQVHWQYVVYPVPHTPDGRRFPDWNGGFSVRDAGHEGFTVDDFLHCPHAARAGLSAAEVLALRLYTGPGYEPLNKSLRANSQRFPVTQYCIDSAVGKLAQLGQRRSLLRGMKKRMHPRWVRQYDIYRGVGDKRLALSDPAFVSTTTDLEVASGSNFGGPVVFLLHAASAGERKGSFLSHGGELDWVSQYPGEAEVLLPSNAIFIPRLRCKHTWDHGLDVPASKSVFEFDVFYPWDFEHNCPLMTDHYLPIANQLLLLMHEVEQGLVQACQDGHPVQYEERPPESKLPSTKCVTPKAAGKEQREAAGHKLAMLALDPDDASMRHRPLPTVTLADAGWPWDSAPPTPIRCSPIDEAEPAAFHSVFMPGIDTPTEWSVPEPCRLSIASTLSGRRSPAADAETDDAVLSPIHTARLSHRSYAPEEVALPSPRPLAGTDAQRLKRVKLYTEKDIALLEKGVGTRPVTDDGLEAVAEAVRGAFPAFPNVSSSFENSAWDMGVVMFVLTGIALGAGFGPSGCASGVGTTGAAVGVAVVTAAVVSAAIAAPLGVTLTQQTTARHLPLTRTVTATPTATAKTGALIRILSGHTDSVVAIAVAEEADLLISGSVDTTARVWDLSTGVLLRTLEGHSGTVAGVGTTSDAAVVVTASADTTARVWNVTSGTTTRVLTGHTAGINSVALSPDGATAATGADDTLVRLWSVATGNAIRVLSGHTGAVFHVVLSADGSLVASAAADGTARLWDANAGTQLLQFSVPGVRAVALSANGSLLATAGDDTLVRIWNSETGASTANALRTQRSGPHRRLLTAALGPLRRLRHSYVGHTGAVLSLAMTPAGEKLASSSTDGTVRTWRTVPEEPLAVLTGHVGDVYSVALSADGAVVYSSAADDTIRVWDGTVTNAPASNASAPTPTDSPTQTRTASRSATASATATLTPPATATGTPSSTPSPSAPPSPTPSPSATASVTPRRTASGSATTTASGTRSPSPSRTASSSLTDSASPRASATPSPTLTVSRTSTSTSLQSPTSTLTASGSSTSSRSLTPTTTASYTPTKVQTGTPSPTTSSSGSATATAKRTTRTASPTSSPTRSATPTGTATGVRTPTASGTGTGTRTRTVSRTHTSSPTQTASATATAQPTPSVSATSTPTPTQPRSDTATATATASRSASASGTRSGSPTLSRTASRSTTASETRSGSPTLTRTASCTASLSATHTRTEPRTGTLTGSRTSSATTTATRTASTSRTPTSSLTPTRSTSRTATLTATVTRSATASLPRTLSSSATLTPTRTWILLPTQTPTPTPTEQPSSSPTPTATGSRTRTTTPTATRTASRTASTTDSRTASPTATQTGSRTASATPTATSTPTATQTSSLTATLTPSQSQTASATAATPMCLKLGPTGYLMGTPSGSTIVRIEVVLQALNVVQYGGPVVGNHYVAGNRTWALFLAATRLRSSAITGGVWAYPNGAFPTDGQWHTVILAGNVMTIDGIRVDGNVTNFLDQDSVVYLGFYPGRYIPPTGSGDYVLRSVRLWSTPAEDPGTLIGSLTFTSAGLAPAASTTTWASGGTTTCRPCHGTHTPSPTPTRIRTPTPTGSKSITPRPPPTPTSTPSPTITPDGAYCAKFGLAGCLSAQPRYDLVSSVVSIEVVLKLTNLVLYGVGIFGNYDNPYQFRWTAMLGTIGATSEGRSGSQTWSYPAGINMADQQWHTVTLAGSTLAIDGQPVATDFPNWLNRSQPLYVGDYLGGHNLPGAYGGTVAVKSVRLWTSTNMSSDADLVGYLTFVNSGLASWTSLTTFSLYRSTNLQLCTSLR